MLPCRKTTRDPASSSKPCAPDPAAWTTEKIASGPETNRTIGRFAGTANIHNNPPNTTTAATAASSEVRASFILAILSSPALAQFVWLGQITGETDAGKRLTIHGGDAGSLFQETNWNDTANPGSPAPNNTINTSSQSPAGLVGPIVVDNGTITSQDFETSLTFISTAAHTFGGTLGVVGTLTKAGPGTLNLTRPQNSFTGDLVIVAGTLALAKDQGNIATMANFFSTDVRAGATWNLVGAPFTLASLQTLKGAGIVAIANRTTWTGNAFASQIPTTISGLTISGTVEPGDSGPGTLTVSGGTVALAPSALLKLEINHATPAIHDRIALSHGLTIAAGATLELTLTLPAGQDRFFVRLLITTTAN